MFVRTTLESPRIELSGEYLNVLPSGLNVELFPFKVKMTASPEKDLNFWTIDMAHPARIGISP